MNSREILIGITNTVLAAQVAVEVTQPTIVEAQTPTPPADCRVPVTIINQYKKEGQLVGPAVNVDFLVRAQNESGLPIRITTGNSGVGTGTFEGRADTELLERGAINLSRMNLNQITPFKGVCGEPVELNIITDAGDREVLPGTVVTPRGTAVTSTPVRVEDIQRAAERLAIADALREGFRMATATRGAAEKAALEATARAREATPTPTITPRVEHSPTPTITPKPEPRQPEQPQPGVKEGEPGIFYVPVLGGVTRFFGDIVFNNLGTAGRWIADRAGDIVGGIINLPGRILGGIGEDVGDIARCAIVLFLTLEAIFLTSARFGPTAGIRRLGVNGLRFPFRLLGLVTRTYHGSLWP